MATPAKTESNKEATGPVISGGHLVAKALKNEGVEVIWTLCGGHIVDIYDGCLDEGIKIIDVRHEQVAAHAADGYSRQSGKIGCVVTTAGPGTTNAMTGIANAFRAESPLLMIGGQGALSQHKMGSLQDLPHVDIMSPITKFAASVPHTERIADMISMAFREAVNGAPGPSYLEIPRDVLDAKVPLERARIPQPGAYRASTKSIGDPADIPVDILKIDRSFISQVTRRPEDHAATRALVALGRLKQLRTVAEGVEREDQLAELLRFKCEYGQGALFSEPVGAADFLEMLKRD